MTYIHSALARPFNVVLDALYEYCKQAAAELSAQYKASGEIHPTELTPAFYYAVHHIGSFTDDGVEIGRALTTGLGDQTQYDSVLVPREFIAEYAASRAAVLA